MGGVQWEWMHPVVSEKLTGRKSYRYWKNKVILRVEIEETRRPMFYAENSNEDHDIVRRIWRDASFEDVMNYNNLEIRE